MGFQTGRNIGRHVGSSLNRISQAETALPRLLPHPGRSADREPWFSENPAGSYNAIQEEFICSHPGQLTRGPEQPGKGR